LFSVTPTGKMARLINDREHPIHRMRFFNNLITPYTRRLLACLLLGATLAASADKALATEAAQVNLAPMVEYLEDAGGTLTIADVKNQAASRFKPMATQEDINLGYSKSTFWFRVPLAKGHDADADRLLEVKFYELGHVAFYAPGQAPVVTGQNYPLSSRAWPHRYYVFPLTLTEEPRYYYLQVRSDSAVTVSLTLWKPAAFAADTQQSYMLQALYYGALLALLLYNLFIYFSLRERGFLLYSLFTACMGLSMLSGNGLAQQFLWPTGVVWNAHIVPLTNALAIASALYFSQNFLQTRTVLLGLHRAMHLTAACALLAAAAPWLAISASAAGAGLSLCMIVAGVLAITAGISALRASNRSARLFLLAWGALSLGAVVMGLRNFGLLPTTTLTVYAVQISSFAEMLLLSFALAERIRLERNAKEAAQAEALLARQSQVNSLRESEARLETIVAERTAELNHSLQNERTLLDRYIRFGALISHEFRNPLAIIKSQLTLIAKERQHGLDHIERRLGAISSAARRLGVLFEEWLQSDRMRRQTQGITPVAIPLAAWLNSLIEDCRGCYINYPFELRIADELPDINADEAMLRIAIHNLVDNAAKYASPGTKIEVDAVARDGMVGIAIIDSGPGIAPEHQDAIFADYYRVVPEGEIAGLGLGLAFVKKIVELHQGWIELKSELGVGTGFRLWLPSNITQ
jgi:signal transduction histidine kinase